MNYLFAFLTVFFIIASVALVLIVLVQRPQGGGLTGAFGGGGGTDTAFGGRTGDALTVATITAFSIYLLLAIGLNITSNLQNEAAVKPAAAETPATTPAETPSTTPAGTTPEVPAATPTATPATTPATTPAPAAIEPPASTPAAPSEPTTAPAAEPTATPAPTGG
jgi:preprotein translocase subunit SecG